jgi:enediyne biosynthesis protein E4
MARVLILLALALAVLPTAAADPKSKPAYPFAFRDVGEDAGLFPHAAGIAGHSAGWGDADGDGWIDLYVGTFHKPGSKPNLFFRNDRGKFKPDDQATLAIPTRATGSVFADLDNDGDLDLYIASMPQPKGGLRGCALFRNDGGRKFSDVSKDNGASSTSWSAKTRSRATTARRPKARDSFATGGASNSKTCRGLLESPRESPGSALPRPM